MPNKNNANRKPSKPVNRQPNNRLQSNTAGSEKNHTAQSLREVRLRNKNRVNSGAHNRTAPINSGSKFKASNRTNLGVEKKPNSNNKKKTSNKILYLVYALAGIALILLVFTVIHLMKDGKSEDDVSKSDETTKTEVTTQIEEGISSSIYFGDICLGDMEYADFEKLMAEKSSEILKNIKIDLENEKDEKKEKKSSFNALDLGVSLDFEQIYKNAEELNELIKRESSEKTHLFLQVVKAGITESTTLALIENNSRITELADIEDNKYKLHPVFVIDEVALKKAVEEFSAEVEIKPGKSTATAFNLETLEFEFGESNKGYKLDTEKLIDKLRQAFSENKLSESIKLEFVESDEVPEEDVEFGFISSGYTELGLYDPARDSNVQRVAELLSGFVIQPGEEFSYWTNITPLTVENGYTYGGAIAPDGSYESVIGGGICQGSSTLYLAAVRADLKITERNNHTIPSAYAIEGIDAMVSDWSDLKFVNNTGYPIAIVGYYVDATSIEFQIYGKKLPPGVTIDLDPHFLSKAAAKAPKKVVNKDLKPGEEVVVKNGIVGSYWSTDKVYYRDGVEYDRVHLNDSHYWSYAGTIEYNPDPPDSTTSESTTEESSSGTTTTTTVPTTPETPATSATPVTPTPAETTEAPTPADSSSD
ncbi:MAG TPA: hypothetical protein GXZ76_03385 [Clostridiaceae bacterium]|nr:hypothetical protein [Clostridiaceae bacterium]